MKHSTQNSILNWIIPAGLLIVLVGCWHRPPESGNGFVKRTTESRADLYYGVLNANYIHFSGEYELAMKGMDDLLSQHGDVPGIWLHCARFWLELAGYATDQKLATSLVDRSIEVAREGLKRFPDQMELRVFMTDRSIERREFHVAFQYLEPVYTADPSDLDVVLKLASILTEISRQSDAIDMLKRARDTFPGSEKVSRTLALAYATGGRFAEAESEYEMYLQRVPDDYEARFNLAVTRLKLNKSDDAAVIFERLVQEYPKMIEPRFQLATIYTDRGDYLKANEMLTPLLDNPIADQNARVFIGKLKLFSGETGEAVTYLKDVLRRYPENSEAKTYLGLTYADRKEWQAGLEILTPILERNPDNVFLIEVVAEMMDNNGDLVGGLRLIEQAIQRIPKEPHLYIALAGLYRKHDYTEKTVSVLETACQIIPDDRRLILALAYAYEERDDWSKAVFTAEPLLVVNPNDAEVLNFIGYTLADYDQELDRAFRMIEQALVLEPENPAFLDSMGWVHFRLDQYAQAVEFLEKAARLLPDDAVILDHLAQALIAAGRTDDARDALTRALQIDPENRSYQDRLKSLNAHH